MIVHIDLDINLLHRLFCCTRKMNMLLLETFNILVDIKLLVPLNLNLLVKKKTKIA